MRRSVFGAICALISTATVGTAHATGVDGLESLVAWGGGDTSPDEIFPGTFIDHDYGFTGSSSLTDGGGALGVYGFGFVDQAFTSVLDGPQADTFSFSQQLEVSTSLATGSSDAGVSAGGSVLFSLQSPSAFTVDYSSTDNVMNDFEAGYGLSNLDTPYSVSVILNQNSLGSATYYLDAGNYEFGSSADILLTQSGIGDQQANTTASFAISVSPGPEPSIWALTIVGIGLTGTTLRKDQRLRSPKLTAHL